jgi:hypothetical protein
LVEEIIEKKESCYFCKENKVIKKEVFWCPRLRHYVSGKSYYGNWVCLECCKNSFFKNTFAKHLEGSWSGTCAECDFPIGAILYVRNFYGEPIPEYRVVRKSTIVREEKSFHSEIKIDKEKFDLHPILNTSFLYYGFEWNRKSIKLVPRSIFDGITKMVLIDKKLPTRKVIIIEDTLTYGALSWGELRRYYWSQHGSPQHFREEKWMDNAPVIITNFYLDEKGINFDKTTLEKIEHIKKTELPFILEKVEDIEDSEQSVPKSKEAFYKIDKDIREATPASSNSKELFIFPIELVKLLDELEITQYTAKANELKKKIFKWIRKNWVLKRENEESLDNQKLEMAKQLYWYEWNDDLFIDGQIENFIENKLNIEIKKIDED